MCLVPKGNARTRGIMRADFVLNEKLFQMSRAMRTRRRSRREKIIYKRILIDEPPLLGNLFRIAMMRDGAIICVLAHNHCC